MNLPPSSFELSGGQTLGRYELLTPIGRGGMATVWAARLRGTHGFSKTVALKTMLPALSADPRFEAMFLGEARIAARIKHPNVCEVFDLGEERGVVYLVMDAVDGEPLWQLDASARQLGRTIPNGVVARLLAQAARGLHAAHAQQSETGEPCGVVHRDVSPQNILVTCEGLVKVVDFGVARPAERTDTTRTASGVIKGKVAYLAPEQIDGGPIDGRVDVFALGIVLHELLCGARPFDGETDLATILAIASDEPAAPLPEDLAIPPALRAIVTRALAKDPRDRHASMRELAAALEAFAATTEHGEDETAAFVKEILGPRRAARRKELRESARVADARSSERLAVADGTVTLPEVQPAETGTRVRPRGRLALGALMIGAAVLAVVLGQRASRGTSRQLTADPAGSVATALASAAVPSSMVEASIASTAVAPPPVAAFAPSGLPAASPTPRVARPVVVTPRAASAAASASHPKRGPLDGWD